MNNFSRHHMARVSLVGLLAASVAACGGGGTGDPAPPPPPQSQRQIDATNYLDAFWAGAFGVSRIADALTLLDNSFTNVLRAGDVAQTYVCSGGGTLTLARAGTVRTLSFVNCIIDRAVYVSGTLSSPNAATISLGGATYVGSGEFTLSNLVYRTVGGDGVNQTVSGTLTLLRRSDQTVQLSGGFGLTRNTRTDMYASVLATFAPRDIIVPATVNTGSFTVATPRFSASPLTVSGNASGLAITAPDQTRLRGIASSQGSLDSVAYEVTPAGASVPNLTQTLATSDPLVQSAIARVLQ
jgi:hypothetical protein